MNRLKKTGSNPKVRRWVRFSLATLIYVLWFVVWTRSWVMLVGVAVIYDLYFTRYIDQIFLNKYRHCKQSHTGFRKAMEWVEALLYAMAVVIPFKMYFFGLFVIPSGSMERTLLTGDYIFVDKWTYGPKLPNTPITFPFVHNTLPFSKTARSYAEWVRWPYRRLSGTGDGVRRNDVVIFNFPEGDTVALGSMRVEDYNGDIMTQDVSTLSYYDIVRAYGREDVYAQTEVMTRPVDKRENYIKRCVAVAGDTLRVIDGKVHINGQLTDSVPGLQYTYMVVTNGPIPRQVFERLGLRMGEDVGYNQQEGWYRMSLTEENLRQIKTLPQVTEAVQYKDRMPRESIFPHKPGLYPWTEDFFGPLWVPKKGVTIHLTVDNLPFYERIIKNYEGNTLEVDYDKGVIYINGKSATEYTFGMDYYFMMGDNRHRSADSRYWGFVPEDHIEGKGGFVWLSIEPEKNIFTGIRWSRMFRRIE